MKLINFYLVPLLLDYQQLIKMKKLIFKETLLGGIGYLLYQSMYFQ